METLRFFFIALVSLSTLASCSKKSEDDVNPDLGARIAGTYTFTRVVIDGKESPIEQSNLTGEAVVERLSESSARVTMDFKVAASRTQGTLDNVGLTDSGSGEVELTKDGFNLGRHTKNTVYLKVNLTNTLNGTQQAIVLIGTK